MALSNVNFTSVIVLSPHPDDGILSCGGLLRWALSQQRLAALLTIFDGNAPSSVSSFAKKYFPYSSSQNIMRLRRAEDRVAAACLGVAQSSLLLPEAIFRNDLDGKPLYRKESDLFDAAAIETEADLIQAIKPMVVNFLQTKIQPLILSPKGIGNHVDHQICREIGLYLLSKGYTVWFYEDMPYALAEASKRGDEPGWETILINSSLIEFSQKIEACAYYRSQIQPLFGSEIRMKKLLLDHARLVASEEGSYAERVWQFKDSGLPQNKEIQGAKTYRDYSPDM